jgi:hypothetical protein
MAAAVEMALNHSIQGWAPEAAFVPSARAARRPTALPSISRGLTGRNRRGGIRVPAPC